MKKLLLSLIIVSMALILSAQNGKMPTKAKCCGKMNIDQMTTIIYKPFDHNNVFNQKNSKGPIIDTTICFNWDTLSLSWIESTMEIVLYDTTNKLSEHLYYKWDGNNWEPDEKTIFTYNSNDARDEYITYKWDGSIWVNDTKTKYFYDVGGYQIEEIITYIWDGSVWGNSSKTIYNWSGGVNDEVTIQSWDVSNWVNQKKYILNYNGMMSIEEVTTYDWNGTNWVEYSNSEYSYDANNNMKEIIRSIWIGSAWEYDEKHEYTYHQYGYLLEEIYSTWNGAWEYFDRTTRTYSGVMDLLEVLFEHWNGTAWENDYRNTLTYPGGGNCFTQVIISEDWTGSAWLNDEKCIQIYCDLTIGIDEIGAMSRELSIYPNPAENEISIYCKNAITIKEINIYDQIGQMVLHEKQISNKIDVSMLRPGMYIIELVFKKLKIREKLIIR
ncbi:MAG: T9SS type A sorting domain-containing protein [Bacteroidales bacterium]|nr:T9SS type A sorting domain-containing protein [Bacteroidales bacterium]